MSNASRKARRKMRDALRNVRAFLGATPRGLHHEQGQDKTVLLRELLGDVEGVNRRKVTASRLQ
jgi:hypothetical protein